MDGLKNRIATLLGTLQAGLYEREHILSLALLAAVAGESLFLLGPPGVAKSMIARRMKLAFREGRAFEYLMSRFSTPDEIFGPVSISRLRDEDRYERLTKGYLPQSEIVFLDEVFKASPSIQNTLLSVLNEHIFRNGDRDEHIPMQLLIAASNELPAQGELEALWDRFLIRCMVGGITRDDLFDRMITAPSEELPDVPQELLLDRQELICWREGIDKVTVSPVVLAFIHQLRHLLLEPSDQNSSGQIIYVSDRRWKKAVRVLRTSAFLQGRSEVRLADALLLCQILWSQPEEISEINRIVTQSLTQAISEQTGLELAQERLDALRIELKCGPSRSAEKASLRTVHTFYHQLKTRSGKPILIYISEFNTLSRTETQPFILITDKLKTGAQILKRYERSKHPGIFPKDILQVALQGSDVILVNGNEYPVLREDAPMAPSIPESSLSDVQCEMVRRVKTQNNTVCNDFTYWSESEENCLSEHLFVSDIQARMLRTALHNVAFSMKRLLVETEEICNL